MKIKFKKKEFLKKFSQTDYADVPFGELPDIMELEIEPIEEKCNCTHRPEASYVCSAGCCRFSELLGKCCDNGNFNDDHDCQKEQDSSVEEKPKKIKEVNNEGRFGIGELKIIAKLNELIRAHNEKIQ